jgi:hypothetical protein
LDILGIDQQARIRGVEIVHLHPAGPKAWQSRQHLICINSSAVPCG